MQEYGAASAQCVTVRAFSDPAFLNELFSDYRDGAALQAGMACQISPGNRLVCSYQVENDTAIDVSRSLARRDLKVGQIDSSHRCMFAWDAI